jgi:membrane-associated phospholipid phosphatase
VLGCGLRATELALFSAGPNTTWGEALAAHATPVFDLLAAVPYTIFIYVVFGYGAYLFLRDRARMRRYVLAFAIANYLAFGFWLFLPAAPPWYLHRHGCGIDLATLPNPGGLERVDALLGIHYFAGFYGRAASVFGALPSLHCAYPLIGLLTAFRVSPWRYRAVHLLYVVSMPLAALYLDHHWVLDVLAGFAVAGVSVWLADRWLARVSAKADDVPMAPLALAGFAAEGERSRAG